jgi:hypothetical protein
MDEYTKEIARVERVTLGYEDHGIFTCMLTLNYGLSGQGAGGYALDRPGDDGRVGTAYGMEFIIRVMRACGVDEWSQIKGRTIMALRESDRYNARIVGLAPLPTEPGEPFIFDELREMAEA